MKPRNGYRRLGVDEESEAHNPLQDIEMSQSNSSLKPNTLKVLYKEQSHDITNISGNTTVAEFKNRIAQVTDVPPERQRLIISGKPLRPDDALLTQFKLDDGAKVHLFPLPVAQSVPMNAPSLTSSNSSSSTTATPSTAITATNNDLLMNFERRDLGLGDLQGVRITPAHYDPYVLQTGREIKMWCVLLIFLSAISLFNNLSYFSATGLLPISLSISILLMLLAGNFGNGNLDTFVFLLDTACSAAGMFVGGMGLKSIRTLDLTDLRKYLQHLMLLALACIVLRVCWVFDVSNAVRKAYYDAKHHQEEEQASGEVNPDEHPLDKKAIAAFTIEATLIALVCIVAWLNCVTRAVRLHNAVLSYQAPVSTTATTANPASAIATAV